MSTRAGQRNKRSCSDDDIQATPSKIPRLELSSGEYPASGIKSTLHGTIYQLKLLMLFLKKGLDKGYEFSLATEMDAAEKFDDLVFEYKKTDANKKSYIFLQAKHKQNDNETISLGGLLSTNDSNPFMLTKYFLSFLKIKNKFREDSDFFIFTNIKFDIIDGSLKIKKPSRGDNKDMNFSLKTSMNCILKDILWSGKDIGEHYKLEILLDDFKKYLYKKAKNENFLKISKEIDKLILDGGYNLDNEINNFLGKLTFSVKQPNEAQLDAVFKKKFIDDKNFELLNSDLITSHFEKKMLDWFKQEKGMWFTKNKAKELFKSIGNEINSIVSIGYGQAYYEKLINYGIEFEKNQLLEELISNKYVSHVQTSSILDTIKIARALEKSSVYKNKDSYLFMRLKTLLIPSIQEKVIKAFKSTAGHNLLIICCHYNDFVKGEIKALCKKLPDIQNNKKIILISTKDNYLVKRLRKKFDEEFDFNEKTDKISFNDLSDKSKEALLKKKIYFQGQGNKIRLDQIVYKEHAELTKLLPLLDILKGNLIEIGKPIPISYGYDTDFYIDRTLNQQITIKAELFNNMKNSAFNDLVAKSQEEFEQLCGRYPKKNVHWLQEELSQWLWKKSQGSLTELRKYIDTSQTRHVSREDFETFLQNAENHQVMLIADTAGMGKTTVLTRLSKTIKEFEPNHWVVRINLNDYTDVLKAQLEKTFTKESAMKFISDKLLKLENPLEKELFIQSFQSGKAAPLVLMFDGFDEISPSYKKTVINLLTTLKSTAIKQLWITTRPHLKDKLEDELQQLSYTLKPFSRDNQIDFLVKFWKKSLELSGDTERLQNYAQQLAKKLAASIKDRNEKFTGIPLQTRMLAQSFQSKVEECLQQKKDNLELPSKLDLIDLYEEFIKEKYGIYQSEKLNKDLSNPGVQEEQPSIFENFRKTHQKLAMKILNEEKFKDILTGEADINIPEEKINRAGLVQVIDGNPDFVHRTFAEYFMADFIVEELKKEQSPSEKFQDLFLKEILLLDVHQGIRGFINGFLEKASPKQEIFAQYGNKITKLFLSNKNNLCNSHHYTMLFLSVEEGNDAIFQFILECIKKIKNNEIEKEIFDYLSNGPEGDEFVIQRAVFHNNLKIVKILVKNGCDAQKLNSYSNTSLHSLHYAVSSGYKDLVDFLIKSKDDDGGGSDVNATDSSGRTALYISVNEDNLDIIESLMEKSDINHQEDSGVSVLHNSIHSEHSKEIVEKLVKRGVNVNVKDNDGLSVLHYAAYNGKLDVIEYLVENNCDINSKSNDGSTILHEASLSGNINLCKWIVKRSPLFINAKDINGRTPLHEAAERDRLDIVEFLEKEGGDTKSTDKHGNNLLLEAAKYSNKRTCEWFIDKGFDINYINEKGETILHISIKYGNLEVVKWLISDKGFDPNIKDKNGNPAIVGICKYALQVASEKLIKRSYLSEDNIHYQKYWDPQETDVKIIRYLKKYKVNFNDKDENGKTILHYAAEFDQLDVVEELVRPNNQKEIVSDITLKDKDQMTALNLAAKGSYWNCVICLLNYGTDIQDLDTRQRDILKEYIEQSYNVYKEYNKQELLDKIKQVEQVGLESMDIDEVS